MEVWKKEEKVNEFYSFCRYLHLILKFQFCQSAVRQLLRLSCRKNGASALKLRFVICWSGLFCSQFEQNQLYRLITIHDRWNDDIFILLSLNLRSLIVHWNMQTLSHDLNKYTSNWFITFIFNHSAKWFNYDFELGRFLFGEEINQNWVKKKLKIDNEWMKERQMTTLATTKSHIMCE